jgi:hypothetical protein
MLVSPVLESLRQKNSKLEASLGYIIRTCLQKRDKEKRKKTREEEKRRKRKEKET